ncbi:MAG: Rad52/Rad22 family DNA repair protein [Gemmataceae bacterium]
MTLRRVEARGNGDMAKNNSEKAAPEAADVNAIAEALARPFSRDEVHWKPQTVKDNRALVVAFVDARVIQDRLDDVLGVMGWQDGYEPLPDGSVVCRLKIRIGGEWITKEDVGGQSEQPDEGDRRKAAFSDALKRAAVKFGIGRYLYRLKPQWVDYDAQKRRITGTPVLPQAEELPRIAEEKPAPAPAPKPKAAPAAKGLPANGDELHRRLQEKDAKLADEGVCKKGEMVKYVVEAGVKEGLEKDMTTWSGAAIDLAIQAVKSFEGARRRPKAA